MILRIPYKTNQTTGGWWTHAYGCIRVDCPACGHFEISTRVEYEDVQEDGLVIYPDHVRCLSCGLAGGMRLENSVELVTATLELWGRKRR